MIWQDAVLLVVGGWVGHLAYGRELARRRTGKTVRESILPKRRGSTKVPDVTEMP